MTLKLTHKQQRAIFYASYGVVLFLCICGLFMAVNAVPQYLKVAIAALSVGAILYTFTHIIDLTRGKL